MIPGKFVNTNPPPHTLLDEKDKVFVMVDPSTAAMWLSGQPWPQGDVVRALSCCTKP